jgi:hypothetical protein
MGPHEELIRRYELGINALEEALRGVPENLLDRAPAPGKWTIRQIAAHLADAEVVIAGRLRWVAAEPGSPLKGFDQEKWAAGLDYTRQSPQDSLDVFRALRRATARMLRNVPESAWRNAGNHEERGVLTLEQLVDGSCGHAEQHSQQIRDARQSFSAAA